MGNVPGKESNGNNNGNGSMSTAAFTREFLGGDGNLNGQITGGLRYSSSRKGKNFEDPVVRQRRKEREIQKNKYRNKQIMNLVVKINENVDGGYLAPYDCYKYELDYETDIVRDLIINRELSPFFIPLQDFNENWTNDELINYILNNIKLHENIKPGDLEDNFEDPNEHRLHVSASSLKRKQIKIQKMKMKENAAELQNTENIKFLKDIKNKERDNDNNNDNDKYLQIPSNDLLIKLYKDSEECPICFLFYPKYLNITTCCSQPICSECFVQMKRLEPHFPHDEEDNTRDDEDKDPNSLISEVVKCPFCAISSFGITYTPPKDIRVGIYGKCLPGEYDSNDSNNSDNDDDDNDNESNEITELDMEDPFTKKKIPAVNNNSNNNNKEKKDKSPSIITIDQIRPDWEQKLLSARTKMARRSAAATAMHATSLLQGHSGHNHNTNQCPNNNNNNNNNFRSRGDSNRTSGSQLEAILIEEAVRLSLLDEEERKLREREKERRRK
ncbi:Sip5 protein [Pichia kluyveri]|uniref:Sip5 protein n=1 Tax=Pichia kluyveri TaxID=36015 RepID=A0AAV5QZU9_PICKL|nr:Sip5 protein [Pichia kluyveri]